MSEMPSVLAEYHRKLKAGEVPRPVRRLPKASDVRRAIREKCHECVGYERMIPTIRGCTGYSCPLYAYRPYQEKSNG